MFVWFSSVYHLIEYLNLEYLSNQPVKPMSHVRKMSPLDTSLVEGAQQPAADQSEGRRG